MEYRQVEGIDAYGFPADLDGHPLLAWMGDDYVEFVAAELLEHFRRQDPGTEMLALKCEEPPSFLTRVDEQTNTVRGVEVVFNLQILLQASTGQQWRLRGDGTFGANGLDEPESATVTVGFEIRTAEEVS